MNGLNDLSLMAFLRRSMPSTLVHTFHFRLSRQAVLFLASIATFGSAGCSDDLDPGKSMASGGATNIASGGSTSSGGAASGGANTSSGGSASSGGTASSGGAASSGGTSSGGSDTLGAGGTNEGTGGAVDAGEFTITSAELAEGDLFMDKNTCASGSFQGAPAPSFEWSGAPEGTQSFALVMIDKTLVDGGSSLGYHSAFWNLPATVTSLPAAYKSADLSGAQVINNGYLGPCPNVDPSMPHTYVFTLYALPDATITLGNTLNAAFIQTLEDAALDTATLSGLSAANGP